jgi:coniferyl-aldehyde dehydrogenase
MAAAAATSTFGPAAGTLFVHNDATMSTLTAIQYPTADAAAIASLQNTFAAHRQAFLEHPFPGWSERRAHLYALAEALLDHRVRIREALQADFGAHPAAPADLAEIGGPLARALSAAKQVKRWMRPERRGVDRLSFGTSKAQIAWQPKGVTGIIAPWNFPIDLSFGPLCDMLAAGNRVIIKMSEYAPACAQAVFEIVGKTFAADHVAVVNGGVELGKAFAALRWDHLLYTGNPEVGAMVAQAAAANLVPVTLELGGKCPAIFTADSVKAGHVARLLGVKLVKNGQMCISIDHCLVPRAQLEEFVRLALSSFSGELKDYSRGADCTGIISTRHYQRQQQMLDEARNSGARIVQLDQDGAPDAATRRLPVSLVIDPDPNLRIMKEEIFGPILPVIPYDSLDETLAAVNRAERPLALYLYTEDAALVDKVRRETFSGGFAVNVCAAQGAVSNMGFGGIGRSGSGRHHGVDGFREFSNPRGMFVMGYGTSFDVLIPPYGRSKYKQIEQLFAWRRLQLRLARWLRPGHA